MYGRQRALLGREASEIAHKCSLRIAYIEKSTVSANSFPRTSMVIKLSVLCLERIPLARRDDPSKVASVRQMGGTPPRPPRVNLMRPGITHETAYLSLITYNIITMWYCRRIMDVSFGKLFFLRRAGSGEHGVYSRSAAGKRCPSAVLNMPCCKKSQTFAFDYSPSQTRQRWAARPVLPLPLIISSSYRTVIPPLIRDHRAAHHCCVWKPPLSLSSIRCGQSGDL